MRRFLAVTLAAVSLTTACSPDPIEQYLDRVTDITVTMRTDSIAALPDPSAPTPEGVASVTAARQQAVSDLTQLVPPNELRPEHAALVLAMSNLVVASQDFLALAAGLSDDEFVEAIRAATDIDDTAQRVAATCDAMQRRATELGYTAGIRC